MVDREYFGEGKNIEFKSKIPNNHEKFLKDVIAFSNSTGGQIIIGVEDETGIVCGIGDESPFKLSDAISNMISDVCTPQIEPDITVQTLEGKTIIVVDIAPGKFRPYFIAKKGKETTSYIRINGTSRPADMRKLQELELEGQKISYDTLQEIGMEYDEEKALNLCKRMRKIAIDSCKTEDEKFAVKEMTLEKLHDFGVLCRVGRNPYPTHCFVLLTDNNNKYSKVQCALFKGITRDIFIDRKEFDGPIYEQVGDAYNFVLRHIDLGAEINGEYRNDVYEIPISAIRETIANAVLHRSYLDKSCIQVCIFDDRVEVYSPGMLYGGLDIATAKQGKSTCRNEAIAEAFQYMHIAEAWGTGIPRIISRCKEYGLKEPLFEEIGDGFRVTIFRKVSNASPKSKQCSQKVSNASPKSKQCSQKVSNASPKSKQCSQKVSNASPKSKQCSQKVSNASPKSKQCSQKVSNAFDKYISLLKETETTSKCIENIKQVFDFCGVENPFSQANVQGWLKCSKSKATNVIKAMKMSGVITKVNGLGHGKYKFIEL